MDLRPTSMQEDLARSFGAVFTKLVTPDRVRSSEPVGFDRALWDELCDLGCLEMVLPGVAESPSGLWEASIVAGLAGRHLAPVPMVESAACLRLLRRAASPASDRLAAEVSAGRSILGVAKADVAAGPQVLSTGAVADLVLARREGALVALRRSEVSPGHAPNLGSGPVAVSDLSQWTLELELLRGPDADVGWQSLWMELRLLSSSWLVAVGEVALDMAAEQARTRHQFGVPIGSFQGISHRLSDVATHVDAARLVTAKAIWAMDSDQAGAPVLAEQAWLQAVRAAELSTESAVHVMGGYGISEEHDIQLYFRRAKATALLGGGRRAGLTRLADAVVS